MRLRVVMHFSAEQLFPPSGVVIFAASCYGSSFPVDRAVSAVLAAGGPVRVSCAPGVDTRVRACSLSVAVACLHLSRPAAVVAGASAFCVDSLPLLGRNLSPI